MFVVRKIHEPMKKLWKIGHNNKKREENKTQPKSIEAKKRRENGMAL